MAEFTDPLVLVSPHEHAKRVKDAQWLLSGHNRFHDTKHPVAPYTGRLDGIYGGYAASATKEAQFLLGYKNPSTVFGQTLYNYLRETTLPAEMQVLRAARLEKLATPTKLKALELAETFVGIKEEYKNRTQFGEWYGWNGVAWCAIFISYCISHVHHPDWKLSFVPDMVHKASMGEMFMSLTYDPEPGDIVTFTLHGDVNCHVEFYKENIDGHSFATIGGNTGPSSINNGGEVARNIRYQNQVSHFIKLTLP